MTTLSRRHLLGLAAAGAVSTGTLAACSSGAGGSDSLPSELTVQIWDPNQQAGVQAAVDGYATTDGASPVRVDLIPEDQYYTKLDASLGAGAGPDVMWQSSKAPDYIAGGALEPLDDYIAEAGIDMTQYATEIAELYNIDGKQYGIPKDMDAWVVVYNAALFAEHGVAEPSPEWTWEDMLATAQQLLDASGQQGSVLYFSNSLVNGFSDIVHQLGGSLVSEDGTQATVDSEQGREAFARLFELVDKGYAPDLSQKADFDSLTALISGSLFMSTVPSWDIVAISGSGAEKDTFKAVRMPSINGDYRANTNGLSYTLNAASKQKDAAFGLIEHLASLEGATQHAEAGAGLPAIAAAPDPWFTANENIGNIDAVRDAAQNVYLRTSTRVPASRPGISEAQTNVMPRIWAKEITVDEGLAEIQETIQGALDR